MNKRKLNLDKAVEIAQGIYLIGLAEKEGDFKNNLYILTVAGCKLHFRGF